MREAQSAMLSTLEVLNESAICWRNTNGGVQFCPRRLDVLQRPDIADFRIRDVISAYWNDLRGRWTKHLRPSQPAKPDPVPPGQRRRQHPGDWPAFRHGDRYTYDEPNSRAHAFTGSKLRGWHEAQP